jgi:hypothetical protein
MSPQETSRKVGGVSAQARPVKVTSQEKRSGRKVGGVSAKGPAERLPWLEEQLEGVSAKGPAEWLPWLEEQPAGPAAGPAASAHGDFVYNGGTVITCPLIWTSFWGSLWLSDPTHKQTAARLNQFVTDLVNSNYMNVLSQYGVGTGKGSGFFIHDSYVSSVPTTLKDPDVRNIIQSAVYTGAIPEPPSDNTSHVLIIFLDENTGVNDPPLQVVMCAPAGSNAFGYHFDFTTAAGNPFYYAVIPSLTDACLKNTCPNDAFCSLHLAQTQEQRRTQVTSHEFIEMCTDPKFSTGWYGPVSDENGDICNGEADVITVGSNSWNVQRQYSALHDIFTNGATFCVTTSPSPLPKLSPGPSGITAAMASAQRIRSYQPFLPLPSVRFDARTEKLSFDDLLVQHYVRKFFYPLGHENFFADFPSVLRRVADILEKPRHTD